MSSNDFLNGRMVQNFANARAAADAAADAHAAVVSWKEFSNKLQDKLEKTELDYITSEAARAGLSRLFKQMKTELQRLDPNNSLLRDEVKNKIISEGAVDRFAELGYDYDPDRKVVRKRS